MLRPTYPIETARLRLRPFTLDDLDALHAIQSRPDVARYLYWGPRSRDEVYHQRLGCGARAPIGDALDDTYDRASATGVAGALGFYVLRLLDRPRQVAQGERHATIVEDADEFEPAAHRLQVAGQGRDVEVGLTLDARDLRLRHIEGGRQLLLRIGAGAAQRGERRLVGALLLFGIAAGRLDASASRIYVPSRRGHQSYQHLRCVDILRV